MIHEKEDVIIAGGLNMDTRDPVTDEENLERFRLLEEQELLEPNSRERRCRRGWSLPHKAQRRREFRALVRKLKRLHSRSEEYLRFLLSYLPILSRDTSGRRTLLSKGITELLNRIGDPCQ